MPKLFNRASLVEAVEMAECAGSTRCTRAGLLAILDQPPALEPAYRVCAWSWYGPEGARAIVGARVIVNGRGDTVRFDLPAHQFNALTHDAAD